MRPLVPVMRFLLNMNIPPALGPVLTSEGHAWRHVKDLGMSRASDAAILAEAVSRAECVITHDLDYGQLLAFSGHSAPSVPDFPSAPPEYQTNARPN